MNLVSDMTAFPAAVRTGRLSPGRRAAGFTLIEVMITVVIVSIIAAVGYPSYIQYVVKAARQAAQSEMVNMTNLQEKIYLNSNAYAASITTAYNGNSTGGLGVTSGNSEDGKYTYSISPTTPGQSYTITATPVTTKANASDGNLTISSTGQKTWVKSTGTVSW